MSRAIKIVALLSAIWLVPLALHASGLDFLMVPIVVMCAASIVRGGRTMIDQIVVAVTVLFGLFCLAGFCLSLFSLGLHPVVLSGMALTAIMVVAIAARRRPAVRWRIRATDVVVLCSTGLIAILVLRQFVQRDDIGRLALLAPGEDFARHFILFDAIQEIGGYAFLRADSVAELSSFEHAHYPQGLHFLFVVLDKFWRSSTGVIGGPSGLDWLVWCHVATYIWFVLAVLWALRRIAGPALSPEKIAIVSSVATAYLFFGDPITILLRGFPNELAGLAFMAILFAILARPLQSKREQVVTIGSLIIGVGFTYYMFFPVIAVCVLFWMILFRRSLLRIPVTVGIVGVISMVSLVPMMTHPTVNTGQQLTLPGTAIPVDPTILLALFLIITAGLTIRNPLRSPAWRVWITSAVSTATLAIGLGVYQYAETSSKSSYYGEKAYHLLIVVGLLGLGAIAPLLPTVFSPGVRSAKGPWLWGRVRPAIPATALILAVFALFGAINGPHDSSSGGSYGVGLVRGREGVRRDGPATAYMSSRLYPQGAGRITVDLSHGDWANFYSTLYGLAMQRMYVPGVSWYQFLCPKGKKNTLTDLERQVLIVDRPVRFLVADPQARFLVPDSVGQNGTGKETTVTGGGNGTAMTNIEAARYLATKYPDRVEVVALGG